MFPNRAAVRPPWPGAEETWPDGDDSPAEQAHALAVESVQRKEVVLDMLAEVLPVEAERHRETAVWLEFVTAARTRPELRSYADEIYDGLIALITHITWNS